MHEFTVHNRFVYANIRQLYLVLLADMIEKEYSFKHMRFQEAPLLGPGAGFPPYSGVPPEFHQPADGGWKPTPGPGLMKDPPIAARNGPTTFVAQTQQQGAVMMVYGLDNDTSNTDKLFNLVCLYGNVARVSNPG